MENLLLPGLAVVVLLVAASGLFSGRTPPPAQIIYVQPAPVEQPGGGCLPVLLLLGFILLVIALA